ncbi:terminase small subunit [Clostridium saccharobutylicum]|uniref:PBSX phage terminase small subunit n=1 Tax=Clostridium saccharobutylicum DSM 13864 TaxID=1345695 RepID=U5MVG4_CLOSA|nr:terminase small subunit [Clostridium saccharobutylicum]AGX44523.1 PBSX phage terminase small subunit [Clostridium saccharobutylicum DSM 13864]AQR91816.1 terminase small subunit [Clostridium saccharobutylicum]AQS01718.1 terminase small subunit [Clostridium saccharobutylicum]AQS11324.1 terminase small subunit [Clostridium saccharobutylicum]AQS15701.1 terminase small subunit [Clostridium saccharobutylicum]
MARAPNKKVTIAYQLYKGGKQLIEISKSLDISESTLKRWRKSYGWDDEVEKPVRSTTENIMQITTENSIQSETEVFIQNKTASIIENEVKDEAKDIAANEDLTNRQRLFCILYSKCFNATKAYQKVYHCSYKTAMVCGCRLLKNDKVKEFIDSLTDMQINKEVLKRGVLQKYIDIAFADITEYVEFGEKEVPLCDKDGKSKYDEDGALMTKKCGYMKLQDSSKLDGTLISEVSESTSGIKFKLYDKMKALDFLVKHCNLLEDEIKLQLESETKKLQNDKLIAEINKLNGDEDEEIEDDGFLEALRAKAVEVWKDD